MKGILKEQIKGSVIFTVGVFLVGIAVMYDGILGRPTAFGTKAIAAIVVGLVCIVNGIRIFNRKSLRVSVLPHGFSRVYSCCCFLCGWRFC
jgi:hypothetical protein